MKHAWNSLPLVVRKEQNIYRFMREREREKRREEKTVALTLLRHSETFTASRL